MLKATKQELNVKKRDGRVVSFDPQLITLAIQKAFCAEQGLNEAAELDAALLEQIDQIGRRKFPYNAQHLDEGFYVNFMFQAEPALIEGLRTKFKLHEDVHLQHYQVR